MVHSFEKNIKKVLTYFDRHDTIIELLMKSKKTRKKQEKINKKLLTKRFLSCKIEKHVWRDIEAVITRRS